MDSDTVAESDMSSLSRSFLHKVNDQVRKKQHKTATNIHFWAQSVVGNSRTCMDDTTKKNEPRSKMKQRTHGGRSNTHAKNQIHSDFLANRTHREVARTHRVDPNTHKISHRNLRPHRPQNQTRGLWWSELHHNVQSRSWSVLSKDLRRCRCVSGPLVWYGPRPPAEKYFFALSHAPTVLVRDGKIDALTQERHQNSRDQGLRITSAPGANISFKEAFVEPKCTSNNTVHPNPAVVAQAASTWKGCVLTFPPTKEERSYHRGPDKLISRMTSHSK